MKKELLEFRKDFPFFSQEKPTVYLDTAATAQKPGIVLDAMYRFYQQSYGTVHRGVYTLSREATEAYEGARKKIRDFIHAKSESEIIFTKGTTHSINMLARSFGKAFIRPKDVILLTEIEHHANLIPWQMLCAERGAELRFIPVNDSGEISLEALDTLLDDKVKIVSIAHLSNVLGTLHPVKEVIKRAHQNGAFVCLDGAQAIAHLPVDVQDLDVDFYVFSGHKIYGPTGVGILYGKKELLEILPPVEGGGDMVEKVSLHSATYNQAPLKFEAGTPMIAEAIGLGHAVDYLQEIGMEVVKDHDQLLLSYATEALSQIPGIRILGTAKEKGGIISFVHETVHSFDLASFLDFRNIAVRSGHHCSQPAMQRFGVTATCRISFGLYNTLEDIDEFISSLKEILDLLQ